MEYAPYHHSHYDSYPTFALSHVTYALHEFIQAVISYNLILQSIYKPGAGNCEVSWSSDHACTTHIQAIQTSKIWPINQLKGEYQEISVYLRWHLWFAAAAIPFSVSMNKPDTAVT